MAGAKEDVYPLVSQPTQATGAPLVGQPAPETPQPAPQNPLVGQPAPDDPLVGQPAPERPDEATPRWQRQGKPATFSAPYVPMDDEGEGGGRRHGKLRGPGSPRRSAPLAWSVSEASLLRVRAYNAPERAASMEYEGGLSLEGPSTHRAGARR